MRTVVCIILYAFVLVQHVVSQERIVAMDGQGGGLLPDSVKLDVIRQRVYGSRSTAEGYNLQKNAGLDAPALTPKLSPINNAKSPRLDVDRYIDSLDYRFPDVAMPNRYAVTGSSSDMIWQRNMFANDFTREGELLHWYDGYVSGYSGMSTMPLQGSVRWAGAAVTQNFGEHWQVSTGATFQKYAVPWNAYNTFSFNGSLMYTLNRNISVSAFGLYESSPFFSRNSTNRASLLYGGYMTLKTDNDKWGVDVGAQTYRDPATGQSATLPIFRPFYNLNGQKLGFDLGGLLYQLFHSLSVNVNGGGYYEGGSMPANISPAGVNPRGKTLGFEHKRR
ncbi:MAG: hypothetical protein ACI4AH_00945 [Muribaculaceae bacterium]